LSDFNLLYLFQNFKDLHAFEIVKFMLQHDSLGTRDVPLEMLLSSIMWLFKALIPNLNKFDRHLNIGLVMTSKACKTMN